ncbi:response regulator [Trinickia caryophylli]|uniref:Two component transcriptional regulator, winged helix family n=1 Tax=Trinickia caryophylli TaxID=28094 RepID=A0A1X7E8I2_TRICW|nr:response regulator [Trinickia caryophylli]PMS13026.1 DNA-binding response regulator [Trinickia caryophylli]TRX14789.1 response regulator transcription factor [Trinickia caryophylli]WQE14634.1 response regulator [Trinickia caryophylli]SMF29512.1 two component transcriptional regulator, winged helix family [Trinickia caryophylli]GLU31947.1 DNA-binding response regulator [Trinickia caryophylli]
MTNALILIAEDEREIAEILDAYLTREGFRSYQVADGQAAVQAHAVLKPDLVLLDVKMPKLDGWQVLMELRRRSNTPVIMLTALDQDIDRLQGLRFGADDYIVKPFNPMEVVARIQAVLRRAGQSRQAGVLRLGKLEIDTESYVATVACKDGAAPLALTLTEFRILVHMARSPGRTFGRSELVDACLPGGDARERTVDSHVSNLRKKLDQAGAPGMISGVRGVGYRLTES